jgi:hypothetical protein
MRASASASTVPPFRHSKPRNQQSYVSRLDRGARWAARNRDPVDTDLQRTGNLFCNLVLHWEQIRCGDVVAIGPQLAPRVGVEQLGRDADHIAGSTDTAAQEAEPVAVGLLSRRPGNVAANTQ